MRKLFYSKSIMMIAGILAAAIIVLSQSFYYQTKEKTEKAKTEQKAEKGSETCISAPADALTSPTTAVQPGDELPVPDKKFTIEEELQEKLVFRPGIVARYFKVLFRAIISPNAP